MKANASAPLSQSRRGNPSKWTLRLDGRVPWNEEQEEERGTNDFKDEFLKISYGKKKHYLIKIIR